MGAPAGNANNWILGPGCSHALVRLWERYHSLSIKQYSELGTGSLSFSELRLISLGVSKTDLKRVFFQTCPALITDFQILTTIEKFLKDENGKSLQKIVPTGTESRVLIDVESRVNEAARLTTDAIDLLDTVLPWNAALLKKVISWIIPIYHEKYGRPFRRGFSHMQHLGVIFTSFAERATQTEELRRTVLAIDLAHELGHQMLMLYQLTDKIIAGPLEAPVYSSVRKTERPAIMALHACVAAAYMMETCDGILGSDKTTVTEREFARNSLAELSFHQRLGLESLKKVSTFTPIGNLIVADLEEQLRRLRPFSVAEPCNQKNLSYFGLLAP